jgi:hypothetical protein
VANQRGHEATHVNWRGLSGAKDWDLMARILQDDFTFVTHNARDFRRLYAREALHAGLVILIPQAKSPIQRLLFGAALGVLEAQPDLINQVLEINVVDGVVDFDRYDLPSDERD